MRRRAFGRAFQPATNAAVAASVAVGPLYRVGPVDDTLWFGTALVATGMCLILLGYVAGTRTLARARITGGVADAESDRAAKNLERTGYAVAEYLLASGFALLLGTIFVATGAYYVLQVFL